MVRVLDIVGWNREMDEASVPGCIQSLWDFSEGPLGFSYLYYMCGLSTVLSGIKCFL